MTQTDIENSSDEGEIFDTTSDGESDLEKLRQQAILSMIKTEKMENEDNDSCAVYEIEKRLKECRETLSRKNDLPKYQIEITSTFINNNKRSLSEEDIRKAKRPKVSEVVKLVEKFIGKPMCVNNLQSDMSRQPALKSKLYEILKKNRKEKLPIIKVANVHCSDSPKPKQILTKNCDITHRKENNCPIDTEDFDRYNSSINEEEKSRDEITKSIDAMTSLIREKLQKSKAITAQIENLKRHKIDLHKEINETRSKISYLHKIKKQKIVNIAKYKNLRKQCELSPISSLSIERIDTLSITSHDTDDSPTNILDCNQIICSLWIHGTCSNKQCGYQHPKIAVKPIVIKCTPVKENDKVFLREMNPLEFVTAFQCEACSSLVHLSNLHIVDDWHCKSCCQNIMILTKPADILGQLINIWHHFFKRYIMSQNIAIEDRSPGVLESLVKCNEALQAKLINTGNIQLELFRAVGRHILTVFRETCSTDESINFIKSMNYEINLVLFVTTLSLPVTIVHQLIADAINHQINKASFDSLDLLLKRYCEWSAYIELSPQTALFQWLEMAVKRNIVNNYVDAIVALTKVLLIDVIGSSYAFVLDLSLRDLQHDETFWLNRKDHISHLVSIYMSNGDTQSYLYLVLNKYRILSLFFTDDEEGAIDLCRKLANSNFYFKILSFKLSLKYNYPITIDDCSIVTLIEHSYNKAEWLLQNRSEKSCLKILETIASKLYKHISDNDWLHYYQCFLGLDIRFDKIISNFEPIHCDSESKLVRESSSIWMCYVNLSVLSGNVDNLSSLIESDALLNLDRNHLGRVFQLIFDHFGVIYENESYFENLKAAFLRIEKYVDFEHFMDLFKSVSFDKLRHCQLAMWLFLVDFCVGHYGDEKRDIFLTEMSSRLLINDGTTGNYDIFSHIILCYPTRVQKVWLNLIQLILNLNLPIYKLIDTCGTAVGCVRCSMPLWRHYYDSAVKIGDTHLMDGIKNDAKKMGFSFS